MKKKNIIKTILILILGFLVIGFVASNHLKEKEVLEPPTIPLTEELTIKNSISLEYMDIIHLSNGASYLIPINTEKIDALDIGANFKDRLYKLYNDSKEFDIDIKDYKVRGYEVKLNDVIKNIYSIKKNDNSLIIFLKNDNTIGVFNYENYYNLMYTDVKDNYNNIENVLKIENNELYYLDGTKISVEKVL